MIRVLLAEDQAMVLGALAALLELEEDITIVGRARDGQEARSLVAERQPDVLLTDIEMPGMDGLELAARLQAENPGGQGGEGPKIIILTTFARSGYLRRALQAGAVGYLLKDAPAEELAEAVRKVHRGLRAIDPELALSAWDDADPLTERERQVLRLAGQGASGGQIASQLNLSAGTVRNYLSEAIGKLGAHNRIEAARIARDRGWL
jgi:two-component system response regulator DesR